MAITHHLLVEKPIIKTILSGNITLTSLLTCFQTIDKYLSKHNFSMMYWVIDVKQMQVSHANLIKIVEATSRGILSVNGDARIIPLVVAEDTVHEYLLAELENRYIWTQFPNFETVDEAVSFIDYINHLQQE